MAVICLIWIRKTDPVHWGRHTGLSNTFSDYCSVLPPVVDTENYCTKVIQHKINNDDYNDLLLLLLLHRQLKNNKKKAIIIILIIIIIIITIIITIYANSEVLTIQQYIENNKKNNQFDISSQKFGHIKSRMLFVTFWAPRYPVKPWVQVTVCAVCSGFCFFFFFDHFKKTCNWRESKTSVTSNTGAVGCHGWLQGSSEWGR